MYLLLGCLTQVIFLQNDFHPCNVHDKLGSMHSEPQASQVIYPGIWDFGIGQAQSHVTWLRQIAFKPHPLEVHIDLVKEMYM